MAQMIFAFCSAFLLRPGAALQMERVFDNHIGDVGKKDPPPRPRPKEKDFEADKDGLLPDHPTFISDPATAVFSPPDYFSQQDDIFMRYMPKYNVVMCGCGKCGSTSMLEYTYDQIFPATWRDTWKGHGPPYVQEVLSDRWDGNFEQITNRKEQEKIMDKAFSFALIRDPKERLISAWKSKLACENWYGVDQYDRAHYDGFWHQYRGFVAQVQRLRGQDENITCMPLEMFAEALVDIKRLGRSQYLDRHFLAQDLGCFERFPPERWSKVATIKDPEAFTELAQRFGSSNSSVYSMHSSPSRVMLTDKALRLLDEATADEYKMLQPYLKETSSAKANKWNLMERPVIRTWVSSEHGSDAF